MEIVSTTIITAFISSLVGAIVGALVSKIKTAKKQGEEAKKEADDLKLMLTQCVLMTCRLVIYSDKFDVDEKLDAYAIYRDRGGNHQTKKYMDNLVGGDVDGYLTNHR